MDVEVLCFHIRELALYRRFDASAFDNLPARHHSRNIKAAHGECAFAKLLRHLPDGIERFLAAPNVDCKPHTVWGGNSVMLVVDKDQLVAGLSIAEADAAGARPIGDPPDGTTLGKFGVRERKKMIELPRLEAADAKIHE